MTGLKKIDNIALIIDVRGRSTFPWNSFRLDGKKGNVLLFQWIIARNVESTTYYWEEDCREADDGIYCLFVGLSSTGVRGQ